MSDLDSLVLKMDELASLSRLQDLAFLLATERAARLDRMSRVLTRLEPGAYLVGVGPSNGGVLPLTVDEVVLGRYPTILEEPPSTVVDYCVNDTLWLGAREVSRVHARVARERTDGGIEYRLMDLKSTTGTFVNGRRVHAKGLGVVLEHGDVISLGPSRVTTFVFLVVDRAERE